MNKNKDSSYTKGGAKSVQEAYYRDTTIRIDLSAIASNINEINKILPKETDIMAVVKANAYGHGSIQVARQALASGANSLAVAFLEEALVLRRAGITAPILVLGVVAPEHTNVAADNQVTLTFFQIEWLNRIDDANFKHPLKLHMKWDTGMGRLGLRTESELTDILSELHKRDQVKLTGVFTHFSAADSDDLSYFEKQKQRFEQLLTTFKHYWKDPVAIHLGNSAAAIRFPKEMYTTVRLGIGMYGLYPSDVIRTEASVALKPAFTLKSKLMHVKQVVAGEPIGYGMAYITSRDEWIGTIGIGYADGWTRRMQGFEVLIDGKKHPIAGRICMDQMMISLDKAYPIGTEVVLIGKQGHEEISVGDVANHLGTINYEIPCLLNGRIPKVYES